jgi:hypothetical protein
VAKNLITVPQNNDENCYYDGEEQEQEDDPVILDEDDETFLRNALAPLYAYGGPPEPASTSAPVPSSDSDENKENDSQAYDRFIERFLDDGNDGRAYHPMIAASALSDDSGCYEAITQSVFPQSFKGSSS